MQEELGLNEDDELYWFNLLLFAVCGGHSRGIYVTEELRKVVQVSRMYNLAGKRII